MNILDTIVERKREEVAGRKHEQPLSGLCSMEFYRRATNGIIVPAAESRPGIIAEFKRMSPSRGPMHLDADAVAVATAYENAGVSAVSILTDQPFFGGTLSDLRQVRKACPQLVLLRKDFIIDPYQLHEASAYGADMVLLIAAVLERTEVEDLALEAASLGLQVLFEVHARDELIKYHPVIRYVGVNNRNLKSLDVDTGTSMDLMADLPSGVVPVSESGLSRPEEVRRLWNAGYRLFLMGERFMREEDPGAACRNFINLV